MNTWQVSPKSAHSRICIVSCTCSCAGPTRLPQLIVAFLQNSLAARNFLLDGFLLAGHAASTQYRTSYYNCNFTRIKYNWVCHAVNVVLAHTCIHVRTHSLVSNGHCLGVSGGDHEADGWSSVFTSMRILHVPFAPIVPEQSVPLPTQNLPLYTLKQSHSRYNTHTQSFRPNLVNRLMIKERHTCWDSILKLNADF